MVEKMNLKSFGFIAVGFKAGLIMKGLFALSEILGGVAAFFLHPERAVALISMISERELTEDPTDLIMNYLVHFGHSYSVDTQRFLIFYLLAHGVIKMAAIVLLWYKVKWAYPVSAIVFFAFIVYQVYHFTVSHSFFLIYVTIVDVVMIVLTLLEYRRTYSRIISESA